MLALPVVRILRDRFKHWLFDLIGIVVIALFAAAYFYPGFEHGFIFGSLQGITMYPATSGTFSHVHNLIAGDQFRDMSPWLLLDWKYIHAGSLPLWNSYSLLGMPQLANFQSAVFSLPHLISYMFAAKWGYSVSVFFTILIAGTGAYATARALGAGAVASTVGAVTFEMSGSLIGWIGWPQAGVNAWLGWIVFFIIMIYRSRHTLMSVAGLSLVVAFALLAGHPESYLLDSLTIGLLGLFFAATGIVTRKISLRRAATVVVYIAGGVVLGGMVASPILLPAVQLIGGSVKAGAHIPWRGIPPNAAVQLLATGYYGYPTAASHWFYGSNFYELSACVGPLAVALAVVALVVHRRRPAVMALAGTLVVLFLITFKVFPAVQYLTRYLSDGKSISFGRLLMPMDFILSILGALGLSILLRRVAGGRVASERVASERVIEGRAVEGIPAEGRAVEGRKSPIALITFFLSSILLVAILAYLVVYAKADNALHASDRSIRIDSLLLSITTLLGGVVVVCIVVVYEKYKLARAGNDGLNGSARGLRVKVAAVGLPVLFFQGVLLIPPAAATEGFSHHFYPATSSIAALQAVTSGHLVGDGPLPAGYVAPTVPNPLDAFTPETNIPYDINYFGAYDPMLQDSYVSSWAYVTSQQPTSRKAGSQRVAWQQPTSQKMPPDGTGWFVPSFTNAELARVYGIRYLISVAGKNGRVDIPSGTIPVFEEPGYTINMVPNSHRFTVVNPNSILHGAEIGSEQLGKVSSWHWDSNNRLTIEVDARHGALLLARITSVPGWRATINGQPAKLTVALDTMLSLNVPAGKSTIQLTYWPSALTYGIILAGAALFVLAVLAAIELYRKLYR